MEKSLKELKELKNVLDTNTVVDWSENDPAEEFSILSEKIKDIIVRESILLKAGEFVCFDNKEDLERFTDKLIEQSKIDDTQMIDYLEDEVCPVQRFEYTFTIRDFIDQLT